VRNVDCSKGHGSIYVNVCLGDFAARAGAGEPEVHLIIVQNSTKTLGCATIPILPRAWSCQRRRAYREPLGT